MSLLIPGMKLDGRPHKALFTQRDGKPVLVVETQYSYADNEVKVYPVEEIPPHGRLGDLDDLQRRINTLRIKAMADGVDVDPYWHCLDAILQTKTIIPAEEVQE